MPEFERRAYLPLLSHETLQRLPPVKDVAPLGLEAIAKIRLFAEDVPFRAYLCGFDRNNTGHGLIVADELRLGCIDLSGLEVAQQVWGICMELDTEWNPVRLWDVVKTYALYLSKPTPSGLSRTARRLSEIQARLAANLSKGR